MAAVALYVISGAAAAVRGMIICVHGGRKSDIMVPTAETEGGTPWSIYGSLNYRRGQTEPKGAARP